MRFDGRGLKVYSDGIGVERRWVKVQKGTPEAQEMPQISFSGTLLRVFN